MVTREIDTELSHSNTVCVCVRVRACVCVCVGACACVMGTRKLDQKTVAANFTSGHFQNTTWK